MIMAVRDAAFGRKNKYENKQRSDKKITRTSQQAEKVILST